MYTPKAGSEYDVSRDADTLLLFRFDYYRFTGGWQGCLTFHFLRSILKINLQNLYDWIYFEYRGGNAPEFKFP